MSIWRSPVFYFGVVLFLLVAAALAAPYVVPWNNYRGQLESYGRKLTGREVAIDGDIAVKLFPWPQLEARNISVGNPDGFSDAAFLQAEAVRVRLSLGGLFNGSIDVETVEAEKPQVNLQRNASGNVNWIFAPQEQVTGQGLLSRVKLDQIVLSRGLFSFDDLRNGNSTVLTDFNALLSAQSVLGPWRMKGDAKWNDAKFDFNVVTSAKQPEQPLKFTVKLSPQDLVYPHGALEGAWDGTTFKGAMRIDPQETKGEKQSAEGAFKPLAMQALIEASEHRLSLLKIKIAPADRKDSGTLIEGDAVVEFGTQSIARLDLKSPRINLDTLLGAGAMRQWRDGGFLSVVNQVLANTPEKLIADYKLNVSVLTSGGQAVNDVRLTGSLQKEALRVHEFVAELPGRSIGLFDGILFPGKDAAQLAGKFKFESSDTRSFLGWLVPSWRDRVMQHWTGSRGRMEVQSGNLDWSREKIVLSDVVFQFDGTPGKAEITSGFTAQQNTVVTVEMEQLDVDSLVPNGWSLIRDGGLPVLVSGLAQNGEAVIGRTDFFVKAGRVLLNGVTAQDARLNVVRSAQNLDIKQLSIGNVGGAELQGGGALVDKGDGPEGVLNFNLRAEDPRGFLRLAGLEYGAGNWTEALGNTVFDATLTAVPNKSGPEIEVVARGNSGALNGELVVTARELEKALGMKLAASGGLSSADSASLAKLVGVQPAGSTGPGDVTFEFNGSMTDGFVVSTRLKALGGMAEFSGTAMPNQSFMGLTGKVKVSAKDGSEMVRALGMPLGAVGVQALDFSTVVAVKDGELSLIDGQGSIAGRRFSGSATVSENRRVEADLETDSISVHDVLGLAFMPWDGEALDAGTSFAEIQQGFSGEVFIRPLQFETQTAIAQKEVVVGIGFGENERRLSITSAGEQGLKADAVLKPRGESYDLEGSMRWPFDLEQHFQTTNGAEIVRGDMILQGDFKSTGRSPAAAIAALEGNGNFWLSEVVLSRITLDGFAAAVVAANTPTTLTAALAKLDSGPGEKIGQRIGNFTIVNGEAVLSPFAVPADGVEASVAPQMDLSSGLIKVVTSIQLKQPADLPRVTITYDGGAGGLSVRNGTSALAAKLGYELLSKEMAELERLQQEQQALVLKEEAQRREDEQRFVDYQNTRAEMREQTRVRRFHKSERDNRSAALQAIMDAALKSGAASARLDLQRHARRLAVRRAGKL